MLDIILFLVAAAAQAAGQDVPPPRASAVPGIAPPSFLAIDVAQAPASVAPPSFLSPTPAQSAQGEAPPSFLAPAPAQQGATAPPVFLAPDPSGLVAEPQVPSGQFTTAVEVKPILTLTRANWVALRAYDGQDLLYLTQLLSWRCGLLQIRLGINGGPLQVFPLPPCHLDTAAPNAVTDGDGPIYLSYPLGAVQSVEVELTYDDLTTDRAGFPRSSVLMP
ncbi:hypothetical protein [Pseudodonghicola flavimaris]|uniref:Uncharacterized protein n=1 Tax=Pseudodonghicola flavimaris TaxID=3050036 RepID=A0ABT7F1G8_9RHOB|nr:hypothetical protein [Pseudodonghicola flavimaris]MDK3018439.1 hypothetical protein [Pseudodonghicola flavimaris]